MLIKQHKSGQATIVLIVVTMMTVLGVAVASSSQSRINLRDTVYSTQALQALSCAEAGADRGLIHGSITTDQPLGSNVTFDSTSGSGVYQVEGCERYDVEISNYPNLNPGKVTVLSIPENNVQEFVASGFTGNKTIKFKSNNTAVNPAVALYVYHGSDSSPQVTRRMVYCNAGASMPASPPADFETVTSSSSNTLTLDNGTVVEDICEYSLVIPSNPVALRVRPLYSDVMFQIENFQGNTGYNIKSTGVAGQVQRVVTVTKFYSQLSGAFDEAIVAGDGILDN